MIGKIAGNMASFYARNDLISGDEIESYKYGFEILLSTICNILLVMAIAAVVGAVPGALCYMAAFALLRCVAGGYHAPSHAVCILEYAAGFAIFAAVAFFLPPLYSALYALVCSIASAAVILKWAPVEAPNKPLSTRKRLRLERLSLFVGAVFTLFAMTISLAGLHSGLYIYVFSGELAAALSVAAGSRLSKGANSR